MTAAFSFADREVISRTTARMLLEIEAVLFNADKPFIFTSGWASPVYIDCRKLISYPRLRRTLIDFSASTIVREIGFESIDTVVGGETAGIPFAAWIAEGRLGKVGHISAAVSFYQPFQSNDHRLDLELGGGCILDLGWYTCGLARFVTGRNPRAVSADAVWRQGVPQRLTAMLWFDDEVTATVSCGYDTATRKWFEVAGSTASLICDDFTRPWADRREVHP